MRPFILALPLILATVLPAFAALPPQYQRQKELLAIVESEAVNEEFGMDGIESVEYLGEDRYRVTGGNCTLDVTIVDAPSTHPAGFTGPREFALELGETACN
ncbi:MAG: hypothetical protein JWR75_1783 [Devosia sp.]|nr:hypothetical protein [Devosia sp.]